jgi:hypothetical protein
MVYTIWILLGLENGRMLLDLEEGEIFYLLLLE